MRTGHALSAFSCAYLCLAVACAGPVDFTPTASVEAFPSYDVFMAGLKSDPDLVPGVIETLQAPLGLYVTAMTAGGVPSEGGLASDPALKSFDKMVASIGALLTAAHVPATSITAAEYERAMQYYASSKVGIASTADLVALAEATKVLIYGAHLPAPGRIPQGTLGLLTDGPDDFDFPGQTFDQYCANLASAPTSAPALAPSLAGDGRSPTIKLIDRYLEQSRNFMQYLEAQLPAARQADAKRAAKRIKRAVDGGVQTKWQPDIARQLQTPGVECTPPFND